MLQGTLAEAAAGDSSNGIGHAAVNLNIDNQALALGWLVYAKKLAAQHGHPYAQYLTRADTTPVYCRGISKEIV
jgi:hypothetical protein